jgi:predicted peptidase
MRTISFCLFILMIMNGCGSTDPWVLTVGQHPQHIETELIKSVSYDLLVYTPRSFGQEKKTWPLIIFLHGSGERGNDPNKLKVHSLPKIVESEEDFPFLVVSPQCPEGKRWNAESLNAMLDQVLTQLPVDTNRIYLTGISMGGYGVWKFAIAYPERFAAIAPVCGWGHLEDVEKLKSMPIWIFHGAKDDVVPLSESEKMVQFLEKKGNTTTKFTVFPNANHNSWDAAYATKELYDWFLLHSRK